MAGNLKMLTYVSYDDKESDKQPLSLRLVARLFSFTKPYRTRTLKLLLLVLMRSIQLPLLAWAVGAVFGGPITKLDIPGVLWGAAGYGALVVFTNATMYFRIRYALELGEQTIHDLRNRMFEHLQTQSMSFYNRTKLGRIISRFTTDAEAVRVGIQDVLFVTLVQLGQMLVAAAFMIYYDWALFMVVLGMAPFD
jgi:ATP-binding cassette subfamily B protein